MLDLLKARIRGEGGVESPGARPQAEGERDLLASAIADGRLKAVEEELDKLAAELNRVHHEMEMAVEAKTKAEADYDTAVRQHYDGVISETDLEQAQAARLATAGTIDRLERIVKLLEERVEAKRQQAHEERLRAADSLTKSVSAEMSRLFLELYDKEQEARAAQRRINTVLARGEEEIKRLGGDPSMIQVDHDALRKSWAEKRAQ